MRLIGSVNSESDARRLGDFLLSIGMRNQVDAGRAGDWQVWVENDDHLDQAVAQFHAFNANPNDPKYADAGAAARKVRAQQAAIEQRRRRNFTDVRTSWAASARGGMTVTFIVAGLCVLMFFLQQTKLRGELDAWLLFYTPISMRPPPSDLEVLRSLITGKPIVETFTLRDAFEKVGQGQVWRLVTPTLLHANVPHVLFNVWAFVNVGGLIEARKGRRLMVALLLTAAVLSCAAQAAWDAVTPDGGYGFVGLSGVVYAVFGYAWVRGRIAPYDRIGLAQQTVGLMLGWLIICMTGWIGPIANAAHVGGLAVGCAIAAWPQFMRRIRQR